MIELPPDLIAALVGATIIGLTCAVAATLPDAGESVTEE